MARGEMAQMEIRNGHDHALDMRFPFKSMDAASWDNDDLRMAECSNLAFKTDMSRAFGNSDYVMQVSVLVRVNNPIARL